MRPPQQAQRVAALPALTPFVAPEALERQLGKPLRLRLGANESPFGPSRLAVEAMRARAAEVQNYGDPESFELRSVLAATLGVTIDHLVVGPGIDALLSLFARTYLDPGAPVVTTLGSYPTFEYGVAGAGGALVRVPYLDDQTDLQALADTAGSTNAKIVYLANPDNPSGWWHDPQSVVAFRRSLPDGCLLLLDEAYAEFAARSTDGAIEPDDPGVVRLRTFSKVYGMAGARIAYAVGSPETVAAINKIRMHFGVSSVAQVGALASLADPEHVRQVVMETRVGRAELSEALVGLGMRSLPSSTNFLTVDVGGSDRAKAILRALLDDGVFIRMPGAAPLDRCIRVTIGTGEERALFLDALASVVRALPV